MINIKKTFNIIETVLSNSLLKIEMASFSVARKKKSYSCISLSYVYYDINYSSHLILIKLLANARDIFEVMERALIIRVSDYLYSWSYPYTITNFLTKKKSICLILKRLILSCFVLHKEFQSIDGNENVNDLPQLDCS